MRGHGGRGGARGLGHGPYRALAGGDEQGAHAGQNNQGEQIRRHAGEGGDEVDDEEAGGKGGEHARKGCRAGGAREGAAMVSVILAVVAIVIVATVYAALVLASEADDAMEADQ